MRFKLKFFVLLLTLLISACANNDVSEIDAPSLQLERPPIYTVGTHSFEISELKSGKFVVTSQTMTMEMMVKLTEYFNTLPRDTVYPHVNDNLVVRVTEIEEENESGRRGINDSRTFQLNFD